jgi:hypothetical protein
MAFSGEYEIIEQAGTISVQWTGPSLPGELTVLALALLAILPFLFIFRHAVARFADRHLHIHWTPRVFGIGAPLLSLICGILLFGARVPPNVATWHLGINGISIQSSNGQTEIEWAETAEAVFDTHPPSEKSSLILKSKDGGSVWIPLSWFIPNHQEKILSFINRSTENRFGLPQSLEEVEGVDYEPTFP